LQLGLNAAKIFFAALIPGYTMGLALSEELALSEGDYLHLFFRQCAHLSSLYRVRLKKKLLSSKLLLTQVPRLFHFGRA
jgi:hypothetical protein